MKLDRLHWSLIAVIVVLVLWWLLTPWEYHHINDNVFIRVHRITGTTERYNISGWREVGSNP
jgi:hypothetical protein